MKIVVNDSVYLPPICLISYWKTLGLVAGDEGLDNSKKDLNAVNLMDLLA